MTNPTSQPPAGPSRGPKILSRIGATAIVLAVIMGIIGVVLIITGVVSTVGDETRTRNTLTAEVPVPGTIDVDLEADTYEIVAIGSGLVRTEDRPVGRRRGNSSQPRPTTRELTRNEFAAPTVAITLDGTPLTIGRPKDRTLSSESTYDLVSLGSFEAPSAGTYRIQATGEPSGVTAIGIDEAGDRGGFIVAGAIGGGLFVFAFMAFPLGVVLLLAGIVWGVVDRISSGEAALGGRSFGGFSLGRGTVTTSTYPASYRPPGSPTSSTNSPSDLPPPPPPPPLPPAPSRRPPPPPPWEPPQSPIS